ncbi:MAG: hypothetical protein EOP06_22975, partial [Proteobacteria bacterium]
YDAFAHFLRSEVASGGATDDTVDGYHREVASWVKWCRRRNIDPETAERYHVEAFREELKRRGLSIATCTYKLSIVRRFYESAIYAGLREDNPAGSVWAGKDLSSPEDKLKILSEGALVALVDSLPKEGLTGCRDRLVVALMAIHGLRRVELHRLNHENIDGDLDSNKPGALIVDGRAHKVRLVHLRTDTWEALRAYIKEKKKSGYDLRGAIIVGHGNNGRGHRLSRVSLNSIVDKYLNVASLKKAGVSSRALRHTFGTLAIAGGAKIEHVRDAMGHAKLETTEIYAKAVEKAKNNPAFLINVEI